MKKYWQEMKEKWGSLVIGACVVVLFYIVASHLGIVWGAAKTVFNILYPVIIGAGIAYILNPFANFYNTTLFGKVKNRKISWYLSVVLAIIVLLVLIFLLLYMLIPELVSSIGSFVENFDEYLASAQEWVDSIDIQNSELLDNIKSIISNEGSLLTKGLNLLVNNIGKIIQRSSSFTTGTVNVVIGFILAIYFLVDKDAILKLLRKFMYLITKNRYYDNATIVGQRFNSIFAKYISCELIDALIVGVVNYVFMAIFKMPYAIVVSVIVALANLVPTFGPIVGALIGAVMLLLADPMKALWFVIFTIILQIVDAYIIKPKLFGDVLNVPGIVILISIIIFGRMFGFMGIFMAIPLAAIIVYILQQFIVPRMEARKARRNAKEELEKQNSEA